MSFALSCRTCPVNAVYYSVYGVDGRGAPVCLVGLDFDLGDDGVHGGSGPAGEVEVPDVGGEENVEQVGGGPVGGVQVASWCATG